MSGDKNSEYLESYLQDSERVARSLREQIDAQSKIVDRIFEAWESGNTVFLIGNGGSAGTATHFAADLVKTTIDRPTQRGVKAMALVDNIPLVSAATNDWGWGEVYQGQLRTFWREGDVVIGFSVHGGSGSDKAGAWSQNLLKALQFAKDNGGTAIGFSGFDGGAMKDLCDVSVVVPAESTPLVEAFHVVLFHGITFRLKERLTNLYKITYEDIR